MLLLLLSGCGQRRQPDVEPFQGEVVVTLQKTATQATQIFLDEIPMPTENPPPSPQTSEPLPTLQTTSTPTPVVPNPQATNYPLTTITAGPPQAIYPTEYLTQTPTFGAPVWEGVWNIWYQNTRGGYTPAQLTVQVSGTNLTGLAKIDNIDFIFSGDIFMQGSQVEGEWETSSSTGTFWWRMNATDTFVGSTDARFGMCGDRGSTTQPNPCREVPQD